MNKMTQVKTITGQRDSSSELHYLGKGRVYFVASVYIQKEVCH